MRTNMYTNNLFVIPESEQAKMVRANRLWHRQDLWFKKMRKMNHWFWFCGDMVNSSNYVPYVSEITKWCNGVGIKRTDYIIDWVIRMSDYSHDWDEVNLEYDHQPANEYYIDPAYGIVGFVSSNDADLFHWAWVYDNEVMVDDSCPIGNIDEWHRYWKKWYPDTPMPISPYFPMR